MASVPTLWRAWPRYKPQRLAATSFCVSNSVTNALLRRQYVCDCRGDGRRRTNHHSSAEPASVQDGQLGGDGLPAGSPGTQPPGHAFSRHRVAGSAHSGRRVVRVGPGATLLQGIGGGSHVARGAADLLPAGHLRRGDRAGHLFGATGSGKTGSGGSVVGGAGRLGVWTDRDRSSVVRNWRGRECPRSRACRAGGRQQPQHGRRNARRDAAGSSEGEGR